VYMQSMAHDFQLAVFIFSIAGLIVEFGLTNEMCGMIELCSALCAESVGAV